MDFTVSDAEQFLAGKGQEVLGMRRNLTDTERELVRDFVWTHLRVRTTQMSDLDSMKQLNRTLEKLQKSLHGV